MFHLTSLFIWFQIPIYFLATSFYFWFPFSVPYICLLHIQILLPLLSVIPISSLFPHPRKEVTHLCSIMLYSDVTQIILFADHSFLGFEWQKRWCVISKTVFYYYGSDKGNYNNNDKPLKWSFNKEKKYENKRKNENSSGVGNWETKDKWTWKREWL